MNVPKIAEWMSYHEQEQATLQEAIWIQTPDSKAAGCFPHSTATSLTTNATPCLHTYVRRPSQTHQTHACAHTKPTPPLQQALTVGMACGRCCGQSRPAMPFQYWRGLLQSNNTAAADLPVAWLHLPAAERLQSTTEPVHGHVSASKAAKLLKAPQGTTKAADTPGIGGPTGGHPCTYI